MAALPPTNPNQRPRTENVYKDVQYITTTTPQLVFVDLFFQAKMSSFIRCSSTVYAISYVTIQSLFLDTFVCYFYVDLCYECTIYVLSLFNLLC